MNWYNVRDPQTGLSLRIYGKTGESERALQLRSIEALIEKVYWHFLELRVEERERCLAAVDEVKSAIHDGTGDRSLRAGGLFACDQIAAIILAGERKAANG